MSNLASRRLIDAAASLSSEERALLSLIVNHGFDDAMISQATRTAPPAIAERYGQMISSLSSVLGLPPENVRDAVEQLRSHARSAGVQRPENGHQPDASPVAAVPAQPAARRASRSPHLALAIAVVIVIALLILAISAGGGGRRSPAPARASSSPIHGHRTLAALAGGTAGATGSVDLSGTAAQPKLAVSVTGLPRAGHGFYEIWLYNSIIDARSLARMAVPGRHIVVALPRDYRRYSWLDVSLQPRGTVNHSGQSILRAAIP